MRYKFSLAYNNRAYAFIDIGEYEKAIADCSEAIRIDPKYATAYSNRGNAWRDKKEYDKAIADYTDAIRLQPNLANAYNSRGYAWSNKKEYDKAIADYTDAIRLDPNFVGTYIGRGWAWDLKQEYDKAIADYSEVIRLKPKGAWAYNARGKAWDNKGMYDKAVADYDEAIRIDPKDASAYHSRGITFSKKNEYDKAIADYTEMIRLNPKDASAYRSRGITFSKKNEYDKAIADYTEMIRLDPKDASAYYGRGIAWKNNKDYDKAIADYNEALRFDPKFAWAHNKLAWILATCPDPKFRDGKRAIEAATKACELDQWKVPRVVDTLAAAYAEAGDFAKAVESQTRAIALLTDEKDKEDYRTRLRLYEAKKPYHEEPGPAPRVVATAPAPVPENPNTVASLKNTTLYLPTPEIEKRFGTDSKPMGNYINALKSRVNAIMSAAEPAQASGLLVAVGIKTGKRVKVWCQAVDGEIPPPLLKTLERELADIEPIDLKSGPVGFGLEFGLNGKAPAAFPKVPEHWKDASLATRSKMVIPPDDVFKLLWPD